MTFNSLTTRCFFVRFRRSFNWFNPSANRLSWSAQAQQSTDVSDVSLHSKHYTNSKITTLTY